MRRAVMLSKPLRSDQLKITRLPKDDHVLIGVEEPGYVRLSLAEAVALAHSILDVAGDAVYDRDDRP